MASSLSNFLTSLAALIPTGKSGGILASDHRGANSTIVNQLWLPVGTVQIYAGATAPDGWMLCNGALVSRTTYSDLFTAISTTFGVGDGSTTFAIPNMQNVFPVGAGGTYTLGAKGGSATHTNSLSEIVPHNHGIGTDSNTASGNANVLAVNHGESNHSGNVYSDGQIYDESDGVVATTGQPYSIMNPYIGMNYIIKIY